MLLFLSNVILGIEPRDLLLTTMTGVLKEANSLGRLQLDSSCDQDTDLEPGGRPVRGDEAP